MVKEQNFVFIMTEMKTESIGLLKTIHIIFEKPFCWFWIGWKLPCNNKSIICYRILKSIINKVIYNAERSLGEFLRSDIGFIFLGRTYLQNCSTKLPGFKNYMFKSSLCRSTRPNLRYSGRLLLHWDTFTVLSMYILM